MIFEEKTIKSDRIYEGSILNLRMEPLIGKSLSITAAQYWRP